MLYKIEVDELRPWSELPTELLRLIVSRLCLEDNVRLSCVCKELGYVARSTNLHGSCFLQLPFSQFKFSPLLTRTMLGVSLMNRELNTWSNSRGELLLVCVSYPDEPNIFKLDLSKMKWVETESLNGATLYVSTNSSLAATDVPRISSISVYFSKPHCYGKYSSDDCRYYPAVQRHEGSFFTKAVWIEPPKMSHLLFDEHY
ncbi:uncharacterized protein LOC122064224 [Macadamia integrifolia]|uniref:uncharacterized protein LOC122064224 n=1 Tax=Macadamia integrifolia TaxID=60698 RepID=UPI001C4E3A85|nr:uncharacterized protein LOC122064224 [Macadamia integrifolia]